VQLAVVVCQGLRKRAFVGPAVGRRDTVAALQGMRYACMDFAMPALEHPSCLNMLLHSVCAAGTVAVAADCSNSRGVLFGGYLARNFDRSYRSWSEAELAEVDRRSIAAAAAECWFDHSCFAVPLQDESTGLFVCMSPLALQRVYHNFLTGRWLIVEMRVQQQESYLLLQESDRSVCWRPGRLRDCAKNYYSADQ